MNVFEAIFHRRSTRSFKTDKIDDKLIGVMLYSAVHAPSAGNTQEWKFLVIKDDDKKLQLSKAALNQTFIAKAPVIIVICADQEKIKLRYGERGATMYSLQDTANATMLMMIAAEALGLSTCWVGAFDEEKLDHILELPTQVRPVAMLAVGYSDETPLKPRRIPFETLTYINKYWEKYDISYAVSPGDKTKEIRFPQIGNYIEDVYEKKTRESRERAREQPKEKKSFADFLKSLRKKDEDEKKS
jgi:nitroreductase